MMRVARILFSLLLLSFLATPFLVRGYQENTSNTWNPSKMKYYSKSYTDCTENTFRTLIEGLPRATPVQTELVNEKAPMQTRPWTVLIYLDGDVDLEEAAFDDLNAMETIGSTADVNIIVYVDFWTGDAAPFTGAACYNISQDTGPTIGSTPLTTPLPTEPNMGDPNTLLNFIIFGQTYAPADNYLLILWDHGAGFYGVCFDETSGNDRLVPEDLATVLSSGAIQPIDIVAFDACLMGQLELAYEIRNYTDFVVFSEESIPWFGFPYEKFLLSLVNTPGSSPTELAGEIVFRYQEAYNTGGIYEAAGEIAICLSAIDTSKLDIVAEALDNLTLSLLPHSSIVNYYSAISQARGQTQSFAWPDFMDLAHFAQQIDATIIDPTISEAALTLSSLAIAAVSSEGHLSGLPSATGLAIAFSTHASLSLELLSDTHYEDFMTEFKSIGEAYATTELGLTQAGIYYGYLDGEDDDVYYRFQPDTSSQFSIQMNGMQQGYDDDFDLYIYDYTHTELDSSVSSDSQESVQYNCIQGNTYFIRIRSYPSQSIVDGLGAFSLTISTGATTDPMFLFILAGAAIVIVVTIIIIVVILSLRRRQSRHDWQNGLAYSGTSSASSSVSEPSTSTTPFCTYCGATLPSSARYCPNCGHERT